MLKYLLPVLIVLFSFFSLARPANAQLEQIVDTIVGTFSDGGGSDINPGDDGIVYYCQGDPRWGYAPSCTLAKSGCVPSTLAMIFSIMGHRKTPLEIASSWPFDTNPNTGAYIGKWGCNSASWMSVIADSSWLRNEGFTADKIPFKGRYLRLPDGDYAYESLDLDYAKRRIDAGWLIVGTYANFPCTEGDRCLTNSVDHAFLIQDVDPRSGTIKVRDPMRCTYGGKEITNKLVRSVDLNPGKGGWYSTYAIKRR